MKHYDTSSLEHPQNTAFFQEEQTSCYGVLLALRDRSIDRSVLPHLCCGGSFAKTIDVFESLDFFAHV